MIELDRQLNPDPERIVLSSALLLSIPAPMTDVLDEVEASDEGQLALQLLCLRLIPMTFQYLALVLGSEYLWSAESPEREVTDALIAMTRRPGAGKWVGFLRASAEFFSNRPLQVIPEEAVHALNRMLVSKDRPRIRLVEGAESRRLDYTEALVNLRNRFAHGRLVDADVAAELVADHLLVWKALIIELSAFFTARVLVLDPKTGSYEPLDRGESVAGQIRSQTTGEADLVLWNRSSGTFLALLPLIIVFDDEDEPERRSALLLEEMRGKSLLYLHRNRLVKRAEEHRRLIEMIEDRVPPVARIDSEQLDAAILGERIEGLTRRALTQLEDARKYIPEMFVERPTTSRELDDWLASDLPGAILVGEPGMGKTSLVTHWCVGRRQGDDHVLLLEASKLASSDLVGVLEEILGLGSPLRACLDTVFRQSDGRDSGRFIVVIDAVNEFVGSQSDSRLQLWREVNALVDRFGDYRPVFKCLVSTRSDIWKNDFPRPDSADRMLKRRNFVGLQELGFPAIRLGSFLPEEVEAAYEKARVSVAGMAPTTAWEGVPLKTRRLIENPFLLRLTLQTFDGKEVPPLSERQLSRRWAQEQALEEAEKRAVLDRLLERMTGLGRAEVSLQELLAAPETSRVGKRRKAKDEPTLEEILLDPRPQRPYRRLVEEGIIEERTLGDEEYLAFAQEKISNLLDEEVKRERFREARRSLLGAILAIPPLALVLCFIFLFLVYRPELAVVEEALAASSLAPQGSAGLVDELARYQNLAVWRLAGLIGVALLIALPLGLWGVAQDVLGGRLENLVFRLDLAGRFQRSRLLAGFGKDLNVANILVTGCILSWLLGFLLTGTKITVTFGPLLIWLAVWAAARIICMIRALVRRATAPELAYSLFGARATVLSALGLALWVPMFLLVVALVLGFPWTVKVLAQETSAMATKKAQINSGGAYSTLVESSAPSDRSAINAINTKVLRLGSSESRAEDLSRELNRVWSSWVRPFARDLALAGGIVIVFSLLAQWLLAGTVESYLRRYSERRRE